MTELLLNGLLRDAGRDPKEIIVLRHRPTEPEIRRLLPRMVDERPDLFIGYQCFQGRAVESAMTRARTLAAFIGHAPGKAVFAGLFDIAGYRRVGATEYRTLPFIRELQELGMADLLPSHEELLYFDLELQAELADWTGKLVIDWPGLERSWWRWADRNRIRVLAINEESRFQDQMPAWDELTVTWRELQLLPSAWKAALAQWRGVYFIFDVNQKLGYVGSAYGADNILGRWLNYAATRHGGNKRLRQCAPENLRFAILERTSPDLDPQAVINLESRWKSRLHTRIGGLNEN